MTENQEKELFKTLATLVTIIQEIQTDLKDIKADMREIKQIGSKNRRHCGNGDVTREAA